MKISYIAHIRLPTERAHGTQIVKTCEAMAKAGAQVKLIIPAKADLTGGDGDIFQYYRLKNNFTIETIKSTDLLGRTMRFGRIFYWIDFSTFLCRLLFSQKFSKNDHVYVRDPFLLLPFSKEKHTLCAEIHDIPKRRRLFVRMLKKAHYVIAITDVLKKELIALGIPAGRIAVVPDAVEIGEFDLSISKVEARAKLGLPEDKKIALYSGHLYPWKGADVFAEAAKLLPETLCLFIGGVDPDLAEFQMKYKHVSSIKILPFQKHDMIPLFLKAADVLVLPLSGKYEISRSFTSPLKLFEYMAAKRPIVASDLPSLREILNESNALLVSSDDPRALADGIRKTISDDDVASRISTQAFADVAEHTWQKRAQTIMNFLQQTYA